MIHEFSVALKHGIKIGDLARTIHVYPTYGIGAQQLASEVVVGRMLDGRWGGLVRRLARLGR